MNLTSMPQGSIFCPASFRATLWILLATMTPVLNLRAGPRSSASYSIPVEATDAGGKRATSGSYTVDASVGGVAGISTVASPAVTAKAGYAGQLYDVTGTTVTAGSSTVNENATVQLGAWQVLDDASYLAVSPAAVTWGVVSGPISGISAGGLATAGVVAQDTAAMVQGTVAGFTGSLSLTVLETIADNFGAYAGDGLEDAWQVQYFGLNNPLAAPGADASGTGQTNLLKFVAGLNPTDHNSRFAVNSQAVPGQATARDVVISPRFSDRTYIVESTSDFTMWSAVTGLITDLGTTRIVTDSSAGSKKFYRVRIIKP